MNKLEQMVVGLNLIHHPPAWDFGMWLYDTIFLLPTLLLPPFILQAKKGKSEKRINGGTVTIGEKKKRKRKRNRKMRRPNHTLQR